MNSRDVGSIRDDRTLRVHDPAIGTARANAPENGEENVVEREERRTNGNPTPFNGRPQARRQRPRDDDELEFSARPLDQLDETDVHAPEIVDVVSHEDDSRAFSSLPTAGSLLVHRYPGRRPVTRVGFDATGEIGFDKRLSI